VKTARHRIALIIRFCIALVSEAIYILRSFTYDLSSIDHSRVNNILIYIPSHGPGIGDLLQFMTVIQRIRGSYPEFQIHLIMNKPEIYRDLFSDRELFDHITIYQERETLWQTIDMIRRIRQLEIDLLIMEFHSVYAYSALVSLLSGIPYRICHASSPKIPIIWSFTFNYPIRMKDGLHRVDQYSLLLKPLGINPPDNQKPRLTIDPTAMSEARKKMKDWNLETNHYIVFGPGSASQKWKRWEPEKYADLADRLIEKPGCQPVFLGSCEETSLMKAIEKRMKHSGLFCPGTLKIKESAFLIRESLLCICNSCGLMHIANAVDTPVLAIYGPIYRNAFPAGDEHLLVHKKVRGEPFFDNYWYQDVHIRENDCVPSLNRLTVDEVFPIVRKKLQELKS